MFAGSRKGKTAFLSSLHTTATDRSLFITLRHRVKGLSPGKENGEDTYFDMSLPALHAAVA